MSDLSATKEHVKQNFEEALDQAVEKLRVGVLEVVRKIFPMLVAVELSKLSSDTGKRSLKRDLIIKLAKQGKRNSEIAREIGCSQPYVSNVLKAAKEAA